MFKNLTYKKKLQFLGLAALIGLFACYRFAIAATITEYRTYQSMTSNGTDAGAYSMATLEAKERKLVNFMTEFALDTLDNSRNLLSIVSGYCDKNDLLLKEYKPFALPPTSGPPIFTRVFTVEGNFKHCLQLVHALENQYKAGRISAVLYKSYTEPKDKSVHLTCTIYIQNLIEPQHEKH